MVGLSAAWFLQEWGVQVTVVDRSGVAAGSSWGNAGWLSPVFAVPLPEPAVLRYGLRSLLDPHAALYIHPRPDPRLWAFLARFALHCTATRWQRGMAAYAAINAMALPAYDRLRQGGVDAPTVAAPILACFERPAQVADLRRELDLVASTGQEVQVTELSGEDARRAAPQAAAGIGAALRIEGQRYMDPGSFTEALASSVRARGGHLRSDVTVESLRPGPGGVTVLASDGEVEEVDAVVLATGAWLSDLARPLGVRTPVRAGRGYSFTVPVDPPVAHPLYLPTARVACTPYQGRLRVAGTMELDGPDAPLQPARVASIIAAVRPLLTGVDWDRRADTWVGPRPITPDGLPLVGATRAPGVYVAGGHGMWGVCLGPATGELLAEQVATGTRPAALEAFDPLRAPWPGR